MAWFDGGYVVGVMSNGWTLLRLPGDDGLRVLNRGQTEKLGDALLKAVEARKAFEK